MVPLDIELIEGFMSQNSPAVASGSFHSTGGARGHGGATAVLDEEQENVEGFFCNNTTDTVEVFEMDDDMLMLRAHIADNAEFEAIFNEGISVYLDGDWPTARKHLEKANKIMERANPSSGGDGPCHTLLEYMEERNWKAPDDWAGFRPLTSK